MDIVDLHLDPNEASDLCPVFDEELLERHGWDRAFVTVLDEATVDDALALIVHARDAAEDDGWDAIRVRGTAPDGDRTDDAEACAAFGDHIYVVGSQFGKKSGPLDPRRSWIARIDERQLERAIDGKKAKIELARLRFGLHRAINDALAAASIELLEMGPGVREAYIDRTIQLGATEGKRWSGRVISSDHPINVEGCEFRPSGRLLLGLRYPVTADGNPILVELDDPEAVFEDPDQIPRCSHVWVLDGAGAPEAPAGIRALHGEGADRYHAVVGDLDAAGKGAVILEDHPEAARATSRHLRFELPMLAAGGPVQNELLHDFGDVRRVEGLAVDDAGRSFYVIDQDGSVNLRTAVTADV